KLLKNAEVVMNDAELWKGIGVEVRKRETLSEAAKTLMKRIKRQLDPQNIFTPDYADFRTD
ncbi:MAG TPA: hypothetical protein VN659_13930, partial [Pyrinomonadaceae bacterium]|nr:hypothetical protein [Pyrinomonadaceae bacterium]